jgi:hypothetical protein
MGMGEDDLCNKPEAKNLVTLSLQCNVVNTDPELLAGSGSEKNSGSSVSEMNFK